MERRPPLRWVGRPGHVENTHRDIGNYRSSQQPPGPAAARPPWWSRVLDGIDQWGTFNASPTRYGVTRYWLVVFPPGIDRVERRLLRAWRAWPTWGGALWLFALCLFNPVAPWPGFAIPTICWLGVGAALYARVAPLRTQVRTRCITRFAGNPDDRSAAEYAEIKAMVATLRDADRLRAQDLLSAAGHEAVWWQVYDRLAADPACDEHRCS